MVTTNQPTSITNSSATFNGTISVADPSTITKVGFWYKHVDEYGMPILWSEIYNETGPFLNGSYSIDVSDLGSYDDWVVMAIIYIDGGSETGSVVEFSTSTDGFTNPTNAYAEDGSFATLPAENGDMYVKLSPDGGDTWSLSKKVTFDGTNQYKTYGNGSSELWGGNLTLLGGEGWIGDDVDDTSFRLQIYYSGSPSSSHQIYKNFGFSIDTDKILTGIEVSVKAKWITDTTYIDHIKVKCWYGATVTSVQAGSQAYVTDGRKNNEAEWEGTGTLAFYDGSDWVTINSWEFPTIDPDNLVEQTPAKLIGDNDISDTALKALYSFAQIDSLTQTSTESNHAEVIKIDDTHFIFAYAKQVSSFVYKAYVSTVSIDSSYNITAIDTLEHDTEIDNTYYPSMVMIDDNHFALIYAGNFNDFYAKTFSLDSSYNITQIDSLSIGNYGFHNSLLLIDDNHLLISSQGEYEDGFFYILAIDSSYNLSITTTYEFYGWDMNGSSLVKISDSRYLLSYSGNSDRLHVDIYNIDSSYAITSIHTSEFYESSSSNSICMINERDFIVFYSGNYKICRLASDFSSYEVIKSDTGTSGDAIKLNRYYYLQSGYRLLYLDDDYNFTELDTGIATGSAVQIDDKTFLVGSASSSGAIIRTIDLSYSGAFKITLNGDTYDNVSPLIVDDYSNSDICEAIEVELKLLTGLDNNVIFDTDHFEVSSGYEGKSGELKKLEAPSVGTDISGAGYLDLGDNATEVVGNGEDYKLVRLDKKGKISENINLINIGKEPTVKTIANNTTYQNTNDNSIIVYAIFTLTNGSSSSSSKIDIYLDDDRPIDNIILTAKKEKEYSSHSITIPMTFIVPSGYYYKYVFTKDGDDSSYNLVSWQETDL